MPILKLTMSSIEKLKFEGTRYDYYDTELKGFGLRVGASSKTFFARAEINGEPARHTIGRFGVWTVDLARDRAKVLLRQMDEGVDPREVKRQATEAARTLSDVFEEYLSHKKLKDTTRRAYGFSRDLYLAPWKDRLLSSITRADVLQLHRELSVSAGEAAANQAMVTFRALWNYSYLHLENPPSSPTKVLTAADAWNPNKRRKDRLLPAQFPAFLQALDGGKIRHTRRDGFLLVLHTGARAEEIAGLLWEHVDMVDWTFTVPDTKNGSDLVLPISTPLRPMFERRRDLKDGSVYVFAGQGTGGDVTLEAEALHRMGFPGLSVHGLRRTFRSLCEYLAFPAATIKVLMNHSLESDITDSYFDGPVEYLRPFSERISAEIARLAKTEH
jgi:integrase